MCRYLIQLLLWAGVWEFSTCCSIPPGTELKTFTMAEVLNLAPVVVSGTDIDHQIHQASEATNFTFEVSCVFKSGGLEIPRTIFLMDVGAISCDGTTMDPVGQSYIVGLKRITGTTVTRGMDVDYWGRDSDIPLYFMMSEPEISTSAAFEVSDGNLYNASRICSVDDTIEDLGEGAAGDHNCPTSDPAGQCVTPTPTSGATTTDTTAVTTPTSGAKEPFVCRTTLFIVLVCSVMLMNYN